MFDGLSSAWSFNPGVIVFLFVLVLLYVLGLRQARQRHARDIETPVVTNLRAGYFFAGFVLAALLLLSPINTIGQTQLFSVHMAQIVLLTTVCAPLIISGCPEVLWRPVLENTFFREIVRFITLPLVASIFFNLTFLLWHAPKIYDYAVVHTDVYATMLLIIFFGSLLNWWPLIGLAHELRKMGYPLQMLYAFFDGQPVDIFAFILVFSGASIYAGFTIPHQLNLSAFGDQAVGGALLLIPGLVDLGVMTPLFLRWLGHIEDRTRQGDQRRQQELEMAWAEEEEGIMEQHTQA